MSVKELSDGRSDGTRLGQDASDKIGFYGLATPVARPATITSVTTTAGTSTTNAYGYTTAAQADAVVASLNACVAALKTLGLVASA